MQQHTPQVQAISRAITRLYMDNMKSSSAKWLYDSWARFLDSDLYKLSPETVLYPVFRWFVTGISVVRGIVPNVAPETDPSLSLGRLVIEDWHGTLSDVSAGMQAAMTAAKDAAKGAVWGVVLPLAAVTIGVALAIGWARRA